MSRLAHNVLSGYAFRAVTLILMLICTPIYIRQLGLEGFGLVGLSLVVGGLLQVLDFGAGQIVTRCIARDHADPQALGASVAMLGWLGISQVLIIIFFVLSCVLAAPWITSHWLHISPDKQAETARALIWMILSVALSWPLGLATAGVAGFQAIARFNRDAVIFGILRYVGAVAVLIIIDDSILSFFIWQSLVALLQLGWAIRLLRQLSPPLTGADWRSGALRCRGELRLVGGLLGLSIAGTITAQLDMLLLSGLGELDDVGRYNLVLALTGLIQQVPTPIMLAMIPRLTQLLGQPSERARLERLTAQFISLGMGVPALMFVLHGETVLQLWTSNESLAQSTYSLLAILTISTLVNNYAYMRTLIGISEGKSKPISQVVYAGLIFLLPTAAMATLAYGAIGTAWSRMIWSLGVLAGTALWVERERTPSWRWRWIGIDMLLPWAGIALGIMAGQGISAGQAAWLQLACATLAGLIGGLIATPLLSGYGLRSIFSLGRDEQRPKRHRSESRDKTKG